MKGISEAEKMGFELLKRYEGGFVSKRDGFVVVKLLKSEKTLLVWIRQRPITREALNLFKKIANKHEYDELVLFKLYSEIDYVKLTDLKEFRVITNEQDL
jgi:hypothetical protein